jgi:hypothetical protein
MRKSYVVRRAVPAPEDVHHNLEIDPAVSKEVERSVGILTGSTVVEHEGKSLVFANLLTLDAERMMQICGGVLLSNGHLVHYEGVATEER